MTRIGRVKAYEGYYPATPYFRLVVENGHVQLGCWRAVGQEAVKCPPTLNPDWESRRTIFERVS